MPAQFYRTRTTGHCICSSPVLNITDALTERLMDFTQVCAVIGAEFLSLSLLCVIIDCPEKGVSTMPNKQGLISIFTPFGKEWSSRVHFFARGGECWSFPEDTRAFLSMLTFHHLVLTLANN